MLVFSPGSTKCLQGGTLRLEPPRGELEGPAVIRRPLTLVGRKATLWAPRGPVLTVLSPGVVLQDLNVEITHDEAVLTGDQACALLVGQGGRVSLNGVLVRGDVRGLLGEEGRWGYARSLRLGVLRADQEHFLLLRLLVPVPCRLESQVAGLEVSPRDLPAGPAEVTITIEPLRAGTRFYGYLALRTAWITRLLKVTGHFAAEGTVTVGRGQVIDQPAGWQPLHAAARPDQRPTAPILPASVLDETWQVTGGRPSLSDPHDPTVPPLDGVDVSEVRQGTADGVLPPVVELPPPSEIPVRRRRGKKAP